MIKGKEVIDLTDQEPVRGPGGFYITVESIDVDGFKAQKTMCSDIFCGKCGERISFLPHLHQCSTGEVRTPRGAGRKKTLHEDSSLGKPRRRSTIKKGRG